MKRFVAFLALFAMVGGLCAQTAGGGLRYSITVTKFENKANWSGRWNLGDAWGTILTDQLVQSGRFIVLGESDMRAAAMQEQDFAASGRTAQGAKTPQVGRMTPAQLLVKGAITHAQETKGGGGGIGFKGLRVGGGGGEAEINITIYLVDSTTGQVKASKSVVGKAGKRGLSLGYHGPALKGLTGDLAGFEKDNMGQAAIDAVGQAVAFLTQQLDSIPWQGTVVSSNAGKVIINRGTREGVVKGMTFIVGKTETIVDPDTGETLDTTVTKVGVIVADNVREKITICQATEGADAIQKGMGAVPKQ